MSHPTDDRAGHDPAVNAPPSAAPEKASLFEDFIDVFYAPSNVYARRQASRFWPYFWIVSVVSALFLFASRALTSAIFEIEYTRNMAKVMEENPQMTEEMVARGRSMAEGIASITQYLGMPLLILFGALFIWIGAKVVKAQVPFGRAMLIASIAQIPRLLGGLLTTVQGLLMDPTTIRGAHQVGYSPARFMDPEANSAQLLGFIARFDLFTLWVTVLFGIGVAIVGKVPKSKGMIAALIAWILGSLMSLISLLRA